MLGNKTFLLLLAMEVLLGALRCLLRALSASFYGDSISIHFVYVFIVESFYRSGLPYDFQKALVLVFPPHILSYPLTSQLLPHLILLMYLLLYLFIMYSISTPSAQDSLSLYPPQFLTSEVIQIATNTLKF